MQGRVRRLGIMGGTFDPIHYGHLVTAESARTELALGKVIFIPSGRPPHKKVGDISAARHRYLMTVLAVATNPWFEVSRTELDRPGYSYTVDTILEFRRCYGSGTEIFFITGADACLEILTWKGVDELLANCYIIAATRPGFSLTDMGPRLGSLVSLVGERIFALEVPALAISSTDIRRRVARGKSVKYLLPEAVEQYIKKNSLYCPQAGDQEG